MTPLFKNSCYVEFFGLAGSGKTYLSESLNMSHHGEKPNRRALMIHSLYYFPIIMILYLMISRVGFNVIPKSRWRSSFMMFKKLITAHYVSSKGLLYYCDHGISQELLKIKKGRGRDRIVRFCYFILGEHSCRIKFVNIIAENELILQRRLTRKDKHDNFRISDLRNVLESGIFDESMFDLSNQLELVGFQVELLKNNG